MPRILRILLKPARRQTGVTLTEILISLSVLALITVAIVPNFRKSSNSEEFKRGISEIQNYLKKAQSSYTSSVKCTSSGPTLGWMMRINYTASPLTLELFCSHLTSTGANAIVRTANTTLPTNLQFVSSSCPQGTSLVDIWFDKSGINYYCFTGAAWPIGTTYPYALTVRDSNNLSNQKTINFEKTGVIRVQ
jgi:type II secretory pathway pseudopilin PulG